MSRPFPTSMPDEEIETLASMFEVPFIKAKGIVFFAEWRLSQQPTTVVINNAAKKEKSA